MSCAKVIAFWILGSHGIAYTPITVPSSQNVRSILQKAIQDISYSWLW